nr:GNAT family N-acetyltransferase [Nocardioides sp.]
MTAAVPGDAPELLVLQRCCWTQEAIEADDLRIPALHESLDDVLAGLGAWTTYTVRSGGRLVGSVRGRRTGEAGQTWEIGRLMVAPDLQGRGLGRVLLDHIQAVAPADVTGYILITGVRSLRNQRIYKKAGFRLEPPVEGEPIVAMSKQRRRPRSSK